VSDKGKLKRFLIYQGPAIGWALFIFILSSLPKLPVPKLEFKFQDKIEHAVAYAVLGYLTARALSYQSRFPGLRDNFLLLAIVLGIFYGLLDEIHQYFVPGRVSDVADLIADGIGVILGVVIFRYRASLRRAIPILREGS
jgi:VanZ family protein